MRLSSYYWVTESSSHGILTVGLISDQRNPNRPHGELARHGKQAGIEG